MDCFVGAATGALKSVSLRDSSFNNLLPIKELLPKQHEITALSFSSTDQTEVLVAQLNRQLSLYDTVTSSYSKLFVVGDGEGKIKGMHVTPQEQIVTACESGAVRIWDKEGAKIGSAEVGEGLLTMNASKEGKIAVGGKSCPLRILNGETLKEEWKCKNVRHDWLELEVPVWDMAARFLKDDRCIATTTGTHEIRMYDPRAQRKPVGRMEWLDEPITSLSLSPLDDHHVIAANTRGEMGQFDVRKMRLGVKFRGQAGAVRWIEAHSSAPLVASCGIDRFLRVHDLHTRKIVSKVYCKARLNTLLLRDKISLLEKEKEEEKDEEDWGKMVKKEEEEGSESEGSDIEDVWETLGKNEENEKEVKEEVVSDEEEDDEVQEIEPPAKKKKTVKETKENKTKKNGKKERKRKESEGEKEEVPEPTKRKKVLKLKRKQGKDEETEIVKRKRK